MAVRSGQGVKGEWQFVVVRGGWQFVVVKGDL